MLWTFEIRDQDGLNPVRLLAANDRKVGTALNSPGQASFTIDLNDAGAIESNLREGRSQLFVYRMVAGVMTLYWSGKVMVVERRLEEIEQKASVLALGWSWALEKRYVGKTTEVAYTAQDAGDILWDLINDSQNMAGGDLMLTEGTIEPSINLTISYSRQKIKDAIDDLISQAGIDWWVSPEKILNVYYPKGTDRSASVKFKYPGSIKSVRVVNDATVISNDILALGRGYGSEELTSEVSDSASIGVFGLFEEITSFKDVVSQVPLDNMAAYYLRLRKSPRLTLDLEIHGNDEPIEITDYALGDTIRIIVEHENIQINQTFRIFEVHATIGDDDKETVRLVVALV